MPKATVLYNHDRGHACAGTLCDPSLPSDEWIVRTDGGNRHAVPPDERRGDLRAVVWQATACFAIWLELLAGDWGRGDNCEIVGLQNKAGARGAACGCVHLGNQSQSQRGVNPASGEQVCNVNAHISIAKFRLISN